MAFPLELVGSLSYNQDMTGLALLDDAGLIHTLRAGVERARSAHASALAVPAEAQARGPGIGAWPRANH